MREDVGLIFPQADSAKSVPVTYPDASEAQTPSEWVSGWSLALAAFLGIFTAVLYVYSTGLFIEPLQAEFGWSRSAITSGMMVVGIMAALGNPLIGMLLDHMRPGRIAFAGSVAYAVSLAMLTLAGPSLTSWWIGWVCISLSSIAISVPVWLVSVVRHFVRVRGKALAISYCGSSVAAITVPVLTSHMIDAFGWRGAYLGLAMLALLTGGLAAAILVMLERKHPAPARNRKPMVLAATARAALLGGTFWRIALMALLVTLGVIGLTVHYVEICVEQGIDRSIAAGLASLIGLAGFAGRLGTGVLLDRFDGRAVGAVLFLLPAGACLFLGLGSPGVVGMALVAIAVGTSLGGELDIMAFLSARHFPLGDYGVLFGVLTGFVGCAAGFGPLLASVLRDLSGSYANLATILTTGFAVSSVLVGSISAYPRNVSAS